MKLFKRNGHLFPKAVLEKKEAPFLTYTLAALPLRLISDATSTSDENGLTISPDPREGQVVDVELDSLEVQPVQSPAEALSLNIERNIDNWVTQTRASLARLFSAFLVAEDPFRRLDIAPVSSLAHQKSLLQYIQTKQPQLAKVLIADEVGLGKTVETGFLIQAILKTHPHAKILYLTPARLVVNATRELNRLGLNFRAWISFPPHSVRPGDLTDRCVVASIHRACLDEYREKVSSIKWNAIIVDECHHVSAWEPEGGSPTNKYRLVRDLVNNLAEPARVIFLSGTPHQGSPERFDNLLSLLTEDKDKPEEISGKVIYRIKDDIVDWTGQPLFPVRDVRPPTVIDLGEEYKAWFATIYRVFRPQQQLADPIDQRLRAAGWRQAQAMQWAASSVEAGLAYLVRQAVRLNWPLDAPGMREALESLRPYRGGGESEPVDQLYARLRAQIVKPVSEEHEDAEELILAKAQWEPDRAALSSALRTGSQLLRTVAGTQKWDILFQQVLKSIGTDKVVLFAQPIETVYSLKQYVETKLGVECCLIVGGQEEDEREDQINAFNSFSGPQFLISSKSGGEGINLQVARRLVHLDVPWNPMDMEQRVGRVHRFGSTRTIIVDTLVVKDSREADCYRVAREKLKRIAGTMGGTRFETIFMRTMALIPPEELARVIGAEPTGPLREEDQNTLGSFIEAGYKAWKEFHERFSHNQRNLQTLIPGSACWEDLKLFLMKQLSAKAAVGFQGPIFKRNADSSSECSWEDRDVIEMNENFYVVEDTNGLNVRNEQGQEAERIGLNHLIVRQLFKDTVLGSNGSGVVAFNKLPDLVSDKAKQILKEKTFGVLAFLEQKVRISSGLGGWEEVATALKLFLVGRSEHILLDGTDTAKVLRALLNDTRAIRTPAISKEQISELRRVEDELFSKLKQTITKEEHVQRIRVAIFPWAAIWVTE